jgi:hypothetical protein
MSLALPQVVDAPLMSGKAATTCETDDGANSHTMRKEHFESSLRVGDKAQGGG